jgi:deoxyribonuclease-4
MRFSCSVDLGRGTTAARSVPVAIGSVPDPATVGAPLRRIDHVRVGSHVPARDVFGGARARGADVVQLHLSAPRQWRAPLRRDDADELAAADIVACVHAPYLCNPASADPQVRERTVRVLQQTLDEAARVGAGGVVVHAGHAAGGGTMDDALVRWVEVAGGLTGEIPLLIENMATGAVSPGRHLDDLVHLFRRLDEVPSTVPIGACLDTCHAFAGDPAVVADPEGWVAAFADAAGGIDVVHVNDSQAPAGGGRDRHANLGEGEIPEPVMAALLATAAERGARAAIVETPGGAHRQAEDIEAVRRLLA